MLFCAVIRREPISHLSFPSLSHVQVLSWEISLVCRLKYPYICFSSHFGFLVIVVLLMFVSFVLFLVAVISRSLLFFLYSLRIVLSMSRRNLQCWRVLFLLIFLTHIVCLYLLWGVRPYSLSLVFLFFCPFAEVLPMSSLRIVPSILWGRQPRCLSLCWDFCNIVWFRVVFSFSWDLFLMFSFISTSNIPKYSVSQYTWNPCDCQ